jgi:hypothetical protein
MQQANMQTRRTWRGVLRAGWKGAGDPARRGSRRLDAGSAAQEQRRAATPRGERQAARGDEIDAALRSAHLADDHADAAAMQGFFHRPQHLVRLGCDDAHEPLGRDAYPIDPQTVGRAAFGEQSFLGNPQQAAWTRRARCEEQSKACRGHNIARAGGGDFVQRSARQAAGEDIIDRRHAKRDRALPDLQAAALDRPDGAAQHVHVAFRLAAAVWKFDALYACGDHRGCP